MSSKAPMSPRMVTRAKTGICSMVTPPKLPSPHTIYDCTPSSVAKKLSSEMADDAI